MAAFPEPPVRLGFLGLGHCFVRRYLPILHAEKQLWQPVAVYDAVHLRTATVARRFRCDPADSVLQLLNRDDLDGVVVCDLNWQKLWPLQQALRLGKPVLCVPPLATDLDVPWDEELPNATGRVQFERPGITSPAAIRLRRLVQRQLTPVAAMYANVPATDAATRWHLLDLYVTLAGSTPTRVLWSALDEQEQGLANVLLQFPNGCTGQMALLPGTPPDSYRLEVLAATGSATLRGTHHLSWTTPRRHVRERLSGQHNSAYRALRRFVGFVRGEQKGCVAQELVLCRIARALQRSRAEGRAIALD